MRDRNRADAYLGGFDVDQAFFSPGQPKSIDQIAAAFDSAARISPAGSVALYSLGREDILEKATAEVVAYLRSEGLLGAERSALEIGCGIGRFLTALAPELARLAGLDISQEMLRQARRRCKDISNIALLRGSGHDFLGLPSRSFDLVLAIDVFPYLVKVGWDTVESNLREARRELRSKRRLLIFNFSYRGDQSDCHDVLRLAAKTGYNVRRCGARPFHWWDGTVFDLARNE